MNYEFRKRILFFKSFHTDNRRKWITSHKINYKNIGFKETKLSNSKTLNKLIKST